ncbi:HD-GYP domain-containing protein [Jeotgalibacillus marinus]|uniref:HD-GYP domain-containing protein n=1 Tax=Jeotgalibacillus marinus TaxID=86667 RepID=A0ABV3Q1K0_9BACL
MKVRVKDLEEGCVIAENIMGLTSKPIVRKNTMLTTLHIEVLQAFQIKHIAVSTKKADGSIFFAEAVDETLSNQKSEDTETGFAPEKAPKSFENLYTDAVVLYKNEFSNWQAGSKVDIVALKKSILPLVERVSSDQLCLYRLHQLPEAEDYLSNHSVSVGLISSLLAKKLGCSQGLCIQMAMAGLLADTGMAKMPKSLLDKSSGLSQEEQVEIRKHPVYSYQFIMDSALLKQDVKRAIYQHHERLDGSGYPKGEKGNHITLYSQIIALADVYHAMTTKRLYRSKQSPFKALETILEDEFGKFDIVVVKALQKLIGNLATGTRVELSNGTLAEVIYTQSEYLSRPIVKTIPVGDIIDLTRQRKLYIDRVV